MSDLAAAKLAQEKAGQTLQATALVHEAYLRLVDAEQARAMGDHDHVELPLPVRPARARWIELGRSCSPSTKPKKPSPENNPRSRRRHLPPERRRLFK